MKLGFIGAGNMARAIINGLIAEQKISGEDVYIHSAHKSSYESYAKEKGLNPCESNSDVVKNAEIVFLAVKPIVSKDVLEEVSTEFERKNPVLVSMVTGVSIAELADALHFPAAKIIRIMPNVNVEIGEGMTALKAGEKVTETEFSEVTDLFDSIGKTTEMEEKDFSTFVALAGSSPAYGRASSTG